MVVYIVDMEITTTPEASMITMTDRQIDAEWENPNTGRTVYRPGQDDTYCEICDGDIVNEKCGCDD